MWCRERFGYMNCDGLLFEAILHISLVTSVIFMSYHDCFRNLELIFNKLNLPSFIINSTSKNLSSLSSHACNSLEIYDTLSSIVSPLSSCCNVASTSSHARNVQIICCAWAFILIDDSFIFINDCSIRIAKESTLRVIVLEVVVDDILGMNFEELETDSDYCCLKS